MDQTVPTKEKVEREAQDFKKIRQRNASREYRAAQPSPPFWGSSVSPAMGMAVRGNADAADNLLLGAVAPQYQFTYSTPAANTTSYSAATLTSTGTT